MEGVLLVGGSVVRKHMTMVGKVFVVKGRDFLYPSIYLSGNVSMGETRCSVFEIDVVVMEKDVQ